VAVAATGKRTEILCKVTERYLSDFVGCGVGYFT
jgi:hypothetical protein